MNSKTASRPALDRSDERVQHNDGLFGVVRAQFNRIKTGDLGTAPVIARADRDLPGFHLAQPGLYRTQ